MNKLTANQRLIIIPLLLISGLCQYAAKKISDDEDYFCSLPLPGWFFMLDSFCRCYTQGKWFGIQAWGMPAEWAKAMKKERSKRFKKHGKYLVF